MELDEVYQRVYDYTAGLVYRNYESRDETKLTS